MRTRATPLSHQSGISIVTVMLGLLVASAVTAGVVQKLIYEKNEEQGRLYANRLKPIAAATNEFISDNYTNLQNSEPITIKGYGPADPLKLTVEDLVRMEYLPAGFNNQVGFGHGNVKIELTKTPVGCVAKSCEIPGTVYVDAPVQRKHNEQNAIVIGSFIKSIGPDALFSNNINKEYLVNGHGYSIENPINGKPVGVIGVAVGWGTGMFRNYLTVNDSRDPNFRGSLTVKGDIKTESDIYGSNIKASDSVGVGTGNNDACSLAEILVTGKFISRAVNCVDRIILNPSNGSITANYSNGKEAVSINGDDGKILVKSSANNTTTISMNGNDSSLIVGSAIENKKVAINGGSAEISAYSEKEGSVDISAKDGISISTVNNIDIGSFGASGPVSRLKTSVANLTGMYGVGTSCDSFNEGDVGRSVDGKALVLCQNKKWLKISSETAVKDSSCTKNGVIAYADDGTSLICSGGKWVNLLDRIGTSVLMGTFLVNDGSFVPKPYCLSGSNGQTIYITPQAIASDSYRVNHRAADLGSQWKISIVDGAGLAIEGKAIASVYCVYPK